jgi:hypothetical protein
MNCFCCGGEMPDARKVKIRRWRDLDPAVIKPGSAAYMSYTEEMTFRWAVVCAGCYSTLDNAYGVARIAGQSFNISGSSRAGKARTLTEEQYREWQRREAKKLGVDLQDD